MVKGLPAPIRTSAPSSFQKCKVSDSVRGTSVPAGPDTVQSSSAKLDCEIEGALTPAPNTTEQNTILDAFADRDDVKIDSEGELVHLPQGGAQKLGICDVLEVNPQ